MYTGVLDPLSIPTVRVEALEYVASCFIVPKLVSLEALKMYCVMRTSLPSLYISTLCTPGDVCGGAGFGLGELADGSGLRMTASVYVQVQVFQGRGGGGGVVGGA